MDDEVEIDTEHETKKAEGRERPSKRSAEAVARRKEKEKKCRADKRRAEAGLLVYFYRFISNSFIGFFVHCIIIILDITRFD